VNATSHDPVLSTAPPLTSEDEAVLAEIHLMRKDLRHVLRTPRRWEGVLRRSALARAIQGSNSIEGYEVTEDDAAAAIDGEEPISADKATFLEIRGYRQALGYVLAMGDTDNATFDTAEIRAMHYMMLSHDLTKSPGRYRKGPIYVHDDLRDRVGYGGPDADRVPALMDALVQSLHTGVNSDPVVRSAMAHLNLVMIHPFRDGNGRMARALATLVLTRSDIGEPEFSSIEEWLGANTDDYYGVLAHTGHGSWPPRDDARLWLAFNLRACM
jgi:Fic family protein